MRCSTSNAVRFTRSGAAEDAPRLIDLQWGTRRIRRSRQGKGAIFDNGGLDIKPSSAMRLMKKDMGGAATAIGLAYLVMAQALPVRLRLLIPQLRTRLAATLRPGDVLNTHKGLTVEIDNTDAEGRLLLCDALSIACEERPEAIFDFATLTAGALRCWCGDGHVVQRRCVGGLGRRGRGACG